MTSGTGGSNRNDELSFFQSLQTQQNEQQKQQAAQTDKSVQKDVHAGEREAGTVQKKQKVSEDIKQQKSSKSAKTPATSQDRISSAKTTSTTSTSIPASTIPKTPQLISPSALLTQYSTRSGASEFSEFAKFDEIAGPEKYLSLVVIMAAVLMAQAKMSSNFWQTLFKEGSSQMQASINLAPAIANATEQDWDAQADISESEASMSLAEGITSLAGFALSVGAGALAGPEADDAEAASESDESTTMTEDTGATGEQESMEMTDMSDSANTTADETENSASKAGEKAAKTLSKGKKILGVLQRSMGYSQMFAMLTQGINSTVTYFYKLKIASMQREVGMWKAVESQLQIATQYYQQGFGRTDNLTQGAEQNFQKALDNLGQIASTISGAISQGFNKVV